MPDVSFTELSGRRVVLRRFRPEDVAEFVAYRSRAEVARYQGWDAPYPLEEGERFIAQIMTAHPDTPGEWFQLAVVLRATGQLVGDCAAMPRADDPSQCEIGFTIAPRYQGRGYTTEAVRLLVGLPVRPGQAPGHCLLRRAEYGICRGAGTAGHAARGPPAAEHLGQGRVDR